MAFLSFVCLVSLLHYFGPLKLNIMNIFFSGIYLALPQTLLVMWQFRLSKNQRATFFANMGGAYHFGFFCSHFFNMVDVDAPYYIDRHFYFGFEKREHIWSYQGFARSLIFTFWIAVFYVTNIFVAATLYLLGILVLIANLSRTES